MTEENLSAELIRRNLGNRFIGREVRYYPSVASTMDIARREARRGAPEGTAIIAAGQTAGRGRLKRAWLSPPGSLSLSLILYPPRTALPFLVMLASVAVVRCLRKITGLRAGIKWPNDVLVSHRKVCGILVETEINPEKRTYAVIGIGINVNVNLADCPEIAPVATSLSAELGREVPRLDVARCLLREIDSFYLALPDGKLISQEWQRHLVTLGCRVTVTAGDTVLEGIAESVAEDGRLFLRQANGNLTEVIAGDVTLRDSPSASR